MNKTIVRQLFLISFLHLHHSSPIHHIRRFLTHPNGIHDGVGELIAD